VITIRITSKEPPCGDVSAPGLDPTPFEGWLGMMRVVSDCVERLDLPGESGAADAGAGRFGGQLYAGGDRELAEDMGKVRLDGTA
jgi:hypothetical protein